MKYFITAFLFLIILAACSETAKEGTPKEENQLDSLVGVNASSDEIPFDSLIRAFEEPDRDSWSKPGIVMAYMGNLKNLSIVELGSGTGYFAIKFIEKGAFVTACDSDQRFIDYLEDRKERLGYNDDQLSPRLVPDNHPQVLPKEADIIFLANRYHEIEKRPEYFKLVKLGLKETGKLVIVDFKKEETPHGPPLDQRVELQEVQKELREAGFKSFKYNDKYLPEQYILIAT